MPLFLSNNKAFLFLHIPKCGGTSVSEMFTSNGYSPQFQLRGMPIQSSLTTSPQHQTCSALKSLINFSNLSEIFTLTRNPYRRLISEFNWFFRNIASKDRPDFSEWVIDSLSLASHDPLYADSHFRPAIDFLDASMPAKVFRLEDGLELISEYFLGQTQRKSKIAIEHKNDSRSLPNSMLDLEFSPKAMTAVNDFYYYDFMALGYRMYDDNSHLRGGDRHQSALDQSLLTKSKTVSRWRLDTLGSLERIITTRLRLLIDGTSEDQNSYTHCQKRLRSFLCNQSR